MAIRPVFLVNRNKPYYSIWECEFEFHAGTSVQQKQKNISELHIKFSESFNNMNALEISTKSLQDVGARGSAFNLMKYVPSLGKSVPVECVYQAGKVYEGKGSCPDLLEATPVKAKNDARFAGTPIVGFTFDGKDYPNEPVNGFYNYIYMSALNENDELIEEFSQYQAFTDIEFNADKAKSCQAMAAAVYVSLLKLYGASKLTDEQIYNACFPKEEPKTEALPFSKGSKILHPAFGEGEITELTDKLAKVSFKAGTKALAVQWMKENCKSL